MGKQIEITPAIEQVIRGVDEGREAFYEVNLREVALGQALAPLLSKIAELRAALPKIAKRADFYYTTERYYDGADYEKEFEGPALLAMYVMMDGLSLASTSTTSFSTFESSLSELGNDLGSLTSYCPAWDWEHGVWTDDGVDHRG